VKANIEPVKLNLSKNKLKLFFSDDNVLNNILKIILVRI
jgi:hypothetical protein